MALPKYIKTIAPTDYHALGELINLVDLTQDVHVDNDGTAIDRLYDLSGNDNHWTASGSSRPEYSQYNGYCKLDGTDDFFTIPSGAHDFLNGDFTMIALVKPKLDSGFQRLWNARGSSSYKIFTRFNFTADNWNANITGFSDTSIDYTFDDEQWVAIWVARDGNTLYAGVNEQYETGTTNSSSQTVDRFEFGRNWNGSTGSQFFNGLMSMCAIYKTFDLTKTQKLIAKILHEKNQTLVLPTTNTYRRKTIPLSRKIEGVMFDLAPNEYTGSGDISDYGPFGNDLTNTNADFEKPRKILNMSDGDAYLDFSSDVYSLSAEDGATVNRIDGISQASSAVLDLRNGAAGVSAEVGSEVVIREVLGMTELNENTYDVTAVSGTDVTIDVDSTGFAEFISGGKMYRKQLLKRANRTDTLSQPMTMGFLVDMPSTAITGGAVQYLFANTAFTAGNAGVYIRVTNSGSDAVATFGNFNESSSAGTKTDVNMGNVWGETVLITFAWDGNGGTGYHACNADTWTSFTPSFATSTDDANDFGRIGADLGGNNHFLGNIRRVVFFDRQLSEDFELQNLQRLLKDDSGIVTPKIELGALYAGQSLAEDFFTQDSGAGAEAVERRGEYYDSMQVDAIDGASGGTYVTELGSTTNGGGANGGWVDDTDSSEGGRYSTELAALSSDEIASVKYVFLNLGQSDAQNTQAHTEAEYAGFYEDLFGFYNTDFTNLKKIFVTPPGRYTTGGIDAKKNVIRNAIVTAVGNTSYAEITDDYDATHRDAWHRDSDGISLTADRHVQLIASNEGFTGVQNAYGPEITSATIDDEVITATITHAGGDDITAPGSGNSMIGVEDASGNEIYASSVSKLSATSIQITLPHIPEGSSLTLKTNYGDGQDISEGDVFKDNSKFSMPLKTNDVSMTQSNPFVGLSNAVCFLHPKGEKTYSSGSNISDIETLRGAITSMSAPSGSEPEYDATAFNNHGGFTVPDNSTRLDYDVDMTTGVAKQGIYFIVKVPDPLPSSDVMLFAYATDTLVNGSNGWLVMDGGTGNLIYNRQEDNTSFTTTGSLAAGSTNLICVEFTSTSSARIGINTLNTSNFESAFDPEDTYQASTIDRIQYMGWSGSNISMTDGEFGFLLHMQGSLLTEEIDLTDIEDYIESLGVTLVA